MATSNATPTPPGRRTKGQHLHQLPPPFGAVLRIFAGYDETCLWQEFGEMKFETRDDITPAFGNPNTNLPRWVVSRYVPWTSWLAGAQLWGHLHHPPGRILRLHHATNFGHFAFRIGDNNNNPYAAPYRRVGAGPWDIMDRGSFNGPGGPHRRWLVPAIQGGSMPAGLMLRQTRIINGFIDNDQLLRLNRDGLAHPASPSPPSSRATSRPKPGALSRHRCSA